MLPELPAVGDSTGADLSQVTTYLNNELNNPADFRGDDTYWTGKGLGRAARIAEIADQLNLTAVRDTALNVIRTRLTDWFTASAGKTSPGLLLRPQLGHADRLPRVVRVRRGAQRPPLPLRLLHRGGGHAGQVRPARGRRRAGTAAWSTC